MSKAFLMALALLWARPLLAAEPMPSVLPLTTPVEDPALFVLKDGEFALPDESETSTEASTSAPSRPIFLGTKLGFPAYVFSLSVDAPGTMDELNKNVDYSPAPGLEVALSIAYGEFGFSWRRPLPQSNGNKSTYGPTSYDDARFEFALDRFAAVAFHQRYDGFFTDLSGRNGTYVRSSFGDDDGSGGKPLPPSTGPAEILQRPDIRSRHFGGIVYYAVPLFHEDVQAFLLTFQSGPRRPAPGWDLNLLSNGNVNYSWVNGDAPFVPQKRRDLFGQGASLQGIQRYTVGGSVGLASSYVLENQKTYFDGAFLLGGGLQWQKSQFAEGASSNLGPALITHLRFGVNHKGDEQVLGFHLFVDNWSAKTRNVRFNSSNLALEFQYTLIFGSSGKRT